MNRENAEWREKVIRDALHISGHSPENIDILLASYRMDILVSELENEAVGWYKVQAHVKMGGGSKPGAVMAIYPSEKEAERHVVRLTDFAAQWALPFSYEVVPLTEWPRDFEFEKGGDVIV